MCGLDIFEKAIFFFKTGSLKMLFRECSTANIVQFLKQTSLLD